MLKGICGRVKPPVVSALFPRIESPGFSLAKISFLLPETEPAVVVAINFI